METNKYSQDLVLEGYGVKLKRLTHDKIELLRQWRNDPKIQQYMIYRETITPEMQEKWFQKINNDHNFYFIIEYEGKEIGCVNIKDVDYEKKCGETGTFIYDFNLHHTGVSYKAAMCLIDFVFDELKLDMVYFHVLKNNLRSTRFWAKMGTVLQEDNVGDEYGIYVLTKEAYNRAKSVLEV